jgi:chemotaxis protein MotA
MDLATLIGIMLGLGLIAASILFDGSLLAFVNVPGLMIVLGGTIAATLVNERLGNVLGAFKVAMNAFLDRLTPLDELVNTIHELSQKSRKDGILGMESVEVADPFLARGVVLAIDGLEADFVVRTMRADLNEMKARHERGQSIFKFMEATCPAFGMIGTLIGLVNMLQVLDDPSSIGPAMAIALLTTFYGAVFAFLIFGPIACKLETRSKEEALRSNLAIAGIEAIIGGENKNLTQTRMDVYLAPGERGLPEAEGDAG